MSDVVGVVGDMRPEVRPRESEIAQLAARQHGVVTHQQLVELGFGRSGIQHRLRARRLHRLHRGVYAVGHPNLSESGRLMAAVLACGPDAVLSHQSAGALWGFRASQRRLIDVTAPRRNQGRRSGIALHLVRDLHSEDRACVESIPVTSLARTLLDLAGVVRLDDLGRALEQAERLRLFDLLAVDALIERSYGRRGVRSLRRALLAYRELPHLTRSEFERRFLALCRDAGLPTPAANAWVIGHEVDVLWAEQLLVVELDSRSYHQTRAAFERDRIRDAALQLAGYLVLRVTRRRLDSEPEAVIRTIRSLLSARGGA
jgi:hypothetical protein